jgi:signal transduction histidine kinase
MKTRGSLKWSMAFALGIIVASGFLGYFGLRSYRYEARLVQKEAEERYATAADLVERKVADYLSGLLSALRPLAEQGWLGKPDAERLPTLLSPPKIGRHPIENLYVFDEFSRMAAPWREISPPASRATPHAELDWGPFADEVERLERLEFAQKDFAGARRGYSALEPKVTVPALKAALLKNIAGDYRRLHQNRLAELTYEKLASQYDQWPDLSGYPMGMLARQMAVELYQQDRAWERALDTRMDLFDGFLMRRWKLSSAERNANLSEERSAIVRSLSVHRALPARFRQRWEKLRDLHTRVTALEQAGESFTKNKWPALLQRMRRQRWLDQGGVLQFSDPPRIALVVPLLAPGTDRRQGFLVAVLSAPPVGADLHDLMLDLARPAGLKVECDLFRSDMSTREPTWRPHLQREIHTMDPPFRFTLVDASSAHDQIVRRRQWIFGGTISLSFLVIVVGLVLIARAVKRETELSNLKADFVANVSHELRTPLAAISHIGETLSLGRYRSDTEQQEFYQMLGQQTFRLRQLVEDVLDFSKMLAGKKVYRRERLDLVALVQECVERFESKAEARGFTLLVDAPAEPIQILGDSLALVQAVLNLMDNALKYSGDSRQIEVRAMRKGTNAVVAVTDHGIGIPEDERGKIFEKFYRVEGNPKSQAEGGVGLGLAMVKHVVEGHGGTIEVESQPEKGSTFSLIFPLAEGETK